MSNIKSEFEKLPIIQEIITDEYDGLMFDERFSKYICPSDGNEEYLNGAWMVWQHQQSKIDELQKENAALVHVIKSRDIQLENEKHEYDELMNKLVDSRMKNAELQKQNAWLSGVAERENKRANNLQQDKTSTTILLGKTIQEKNELTKQRDSFIKAYEIEIDKSDELQKRVDLTLQLVNEMKGKRYPFSAYADQLEQALKDGGK